MPTIAALMSRYCDGDAAAFRELHRKVAPSLLRLLIDLEADEVTAQHLLEVTFLAVHRYRSAYIEGTDPMPWIESIARRTFLDGRTGMRRFAS